MQQLPRHLFKWRKTGKICSCIILREFPTWKQWHTDCWKFVLSFSNTLQERLGWWIHQRVRGIFTNRSFYCCEKKILMHIGQGSATLCSVCCSAVATLAEEYPPQLLYQVLSTNILPALTSRCHSNDSKLSIFFQFLVVKNPMKWKPYIWRNSENLYSLTFLVDQYPLKQDPWNIQVFAK